MDSKENKPIVIFLKRAGDFLAYILWLALLIFSLIAPMFAFGYGISDFFSNTKRTTTSSSNEFISADPSMVWVDNTAKRYHKKNGCNMDNAYQVTIEAAEAMGKTPCRNCYR